MGISNEGMISREKHWEEMTQEQKMEKMSGTIQYLAQVIEELMLLKQHDHLSGNIVVPMNKDIPYWLSNPLNSKDRR